MAPKINVTISRSFFEYFWQENSILWANTFLNFDAKNKSQNLHMFLPAKKYRNVMEYFLDNYVRGCGRLHDDCSAPSGSSKLIIIT